jgi:hypothetical protein
MKVGKIAQKYTWEKVSLHFSADRYLLEMVDRSVWLEGQSHLPSTLALIPKADTSSLTEEAFVGQHQKEWCSSKEDIR